MEKLADALYRIKLIYMPIVAKGQHSEAHFLAEHALAEYEKNNA